MSLIVASTNLGSCPKSLSLVFLFCASLAPSPSKAQSVPVRQLTLIQPNDPGFDDLLTTNFPGLDSLDGYATYRPFLVLLRNDTLHSARAYSIAWDIQYPGGPNQIETDFIQKYHQSKAQARAFASGELRLIAPFFNTSPQEYVIRRTIIANRMSAFVNHLPYSASNIKSVSPTVDAAIFDDGLYIGPDRFFLLTRYQCMREVEHDLAEALLKVMDSKGPTDEVVSILQRDIQAGLAANTSSRERAAICALYRGEQAQMLLGLYRTGGVESVFTRAWAMDQRPRETISRALPN